MKTHIYSLWALLLFSFAACQRNEVTNVVLSESEKVLKVGETLQLGAVVEATKDVGEFTRVWASEDENVVSVTQDGLVTALAPGKTLVTLTVGGRKAECRVGVKYFAKAQCKYKRDPYETGFSDLHILCLATDNVDTETLSGSGEYLSIELFVGTDVQNSIPVGMYEMVSDFTPAADGKYSEEYEKLLPYTLSPGFVLGEANYGTWFVNLTTGQTTPLQTGTVEVRRSTDDSYLIHYDLFDGQGRPFAGVYEGKID